MELRELKELSRTEDRKYLDGEFLLSIIKNFDTMIDAARAYYIPWSSNQHRKYSDEGEAERLESQRDLIYKLIHEAENFNDLSKSLAREEELYDTQFWGAYFTKIKKVDVLGSHAEVEIFELAVSNYARYLEKTEEATTYKTVKCGDTLESKSFRVHLGNTDLEVPFFTSNNYGYITVVEMDIRDFNYSLFSEKQLFRGEFEITTYQNEKIKFGGCYYMYKFENYVFFVKNKTENTYVE